MCLVSCVLYPVPCVTCYVSCVICHISAYGILSGFILIFFINQLDDNLLLAYIGMYLAVLVARHAPAEQINCFQVVPRY